MRCAVLALFLTLPILVVPAQDVFQIENHFGGEAAWTEAYLEAAWQSLVDLFDNPDVDPPVGIRVVLQKDDSMRGLSGYASPVEIGFRSDCFPQDNYRLWITVHELINLFAHHYGGGGGYPSDWWANGRSAFPWYLSCIVMETLGYQEAAEYQMGVNMHKPDHRLFFELHERYGFSLFSRFFKLVRADGVVMANIGAPWPRPDEVRSAYTIAYLSISAGENLAPVFAEHHIGREPADWQRVHGEIPFIEYRVSEREVDRIITERGALFDASGTVEDLRSRRLAFRTGLSYQADPDDPGDDSDDGEDLQEVLVRARTGWTESPDFVLRSEYGDESRWMEGFLHSVGASLVGLMDLDVVDLVEPVMVFLRKEPDLNGIGGSAQRQYIDLISSSWPEEQFRYWIVSQEVAEYLCFNAGGNLEGDGWSIGRQDFATFLGILALYSIDYADVADWTKSMYIEHPDHALYWRLVDRYGIAWIGDLFRLMRQDSVDFRRVPAPKRGLTFVAYLSMACDENLADLCDESGFGWKPYDWESRFPDTPFEECQFSRENIEELMN